MFSRAGDLLPPRGVYKNGFYQLNYTPILFSLRPLLGRRPGTRGSSRERKELIPGIEPGFGY